jgi:[ribosomal protein S5]-alanine N-acetyltransferase
VEVVGPSLTLRYATASDAAVLLALGSDPEVTRFFSWGPYASIEEPARYVAGLEDERDRGERLEFLIVDQIRDRAAVSDRSAGAATRSTGTPGRPLGVTGLTELSQRDRRAVVGTWLGRAHWGTGANREAKALIAHLAFGVLGLERLGAYADLDNPRSQVALERIGFVREGVLRRWHRHGEQVHDVIVYSWLAEEWERSPLRDIQAQVRGEPPAAFQPTAHARELTSSL